MTLNPKLAMPLGPRVSAFLTAKNIDPTKVTELEASVVWGDQAQLTYQCLETITADEFLELRKAGVDDYEEGKQ